MKRLILALLLIPTLAYPFGFNFSFNFGGNQQARLIDLQSEMVLTPTSHDFGEQDTGTNTDFDVDVNNPGNDTLEGVTLVAEDENFSVFSTDCGDEPFDLEPDTYCTVTVRFTPATAGAKTGTFTASAPNLDDVVATLAGEGVEAADVTAPTLTSTTVAANGTTLTLAMSETVTRTGGVFDVDCPSASNIAATYSSGSGTPSLVYTLGATVLASDSSCNIDYNGAANGIEDAAGNDLATIASAAVTNNSTQSEVISISDDFSSDTSAIYIKAGGSSSGIIVTGGYAHRSEQYAPSIVFHPTSLESNDMEVEGLLMLISGDSTGVGLRGDGTPGAGVGYVAYLESTQLILKTFSGTALTAAGLWTLPGTLTVSQYYKVKVSVVGNTFHAWIDWNDNGVYTDSGEDLSTITDSAISTGTYAGMALSQGAGYDPHIDNFSAVAK